MNLTHISVINTVFEMNEDNHFTEPDMRTAKGIDWLINNSKRRKD